MGLASAIPPPIQPGLLTAVLPTACAASQFYTIDIRMPTPPPIPAYAPLDIAHLRARLADATVGHTLLYYPKVVSTMPLAAALADDPQSAPVRECTLTLDVPQTPESAEPFPAWHDAARQLADEMDAVLVDDQGTPVTLHAFAAIGAELKTLYRQLESLDLAAGSAAARRLFG